MRFVDIVRIRRESPEEVMERYDKRRRELWGEISDLADDGEIRYAMRRAGVLIDYVMIGPTQRRELFVLGRARLSLPDAPLRRQRGIRET